MLTPAQAEDDIRSLLWEKWQEGLEFGYQSVNQQTCELEIVEPRIFRIGGIYEATETQPVGEIYSPELAWERQDINLKIDEGKHIARVAIEHVSNRLADKRTLAENSLLRERNRGLVTVQIFYSPSAYYDEDNQYLTLMVRQIFRRRKTSPNMVRFVRANIAKQPKSEIYYQTNVYAEFEYDELVN